MREKNRLDRVLSIKLTIEYLDLLYIHNKKVLVLIGQGWWLREPDTIKLNTDMT